MIKKIIFAVLLIIISDNYIYSEHENTVSLAELIVKAKENNPDILAAKLKWSAVQASVVPSRTWSDPRFGIMWEKIPTDKISLGDSQMQIYSISQAIPFPGKLSLKGRIFKETANIHEQIYRTIELAVIANLKKAYYEYFYIHKSIEIYQENSDLITHFSKVAEQRYAIGRARQIDVLKAQVELSKIFNMLITLNQDKETIAADINTLLNRPPDAPLGVPIKPEFDLFKLSLKELEEMALNNRPELIAIKNAISRSKKSLTLAKMGYLPNFTVAYKQRRIDSEFDSWDANLGLTFPLYFWKQSGIVKEKSFVRNESKAKYKSVENTTRYNVKALYVKINTAQRLANLYKTNFLPQAEQALKIAEIAYRTEKISFLDLLDSERSLLDFQLEYYKYLTSYKKYIAELERVVGGELE